MSTVIKYQLKLQSDGEIGTGLGSELVNDLVVRDHNRRPVVRASHIKGLLLDQLGRMIDAVEWGESLADWCFGREGSDARTGMVRFSDAICKADPAGCEKEAVRTITRTSVNTLGTAADTSLRTTEAVVVEAVFEGSVRIDAGCPAPVELAIRLALLSLEAVGGGRTRGAGCCLIEIEGETRSPGELMKELHALRPGEMNAPGYIEPVVLSPVRDEGERVFLRLRFCAEQPVCCPEIPVSGNNVIRSGIAIPASAVLGAVVARLAQRDETLAQRALATVATRAWPLLPCARAGSEPGGHPVQVALSHRMSKLPIDEKYEFRDGAIEPYDWKTASPNSPLKGSDGVLLRSDDGVVRLWKSGNMPREVAGHAVLNTEPTLYSVESMAPMIYEGYVSLIPEAADALIESLQADGHVSFGKSRTVRGSGVLTVEKVDRLPEWNEQVFVLQSPAAIPDDWEMDAESAETLLARLVEESGWGSVQAGENDTGLISVPVLAKCGVRFGWNTHGVGNGVGETRRLQARRVFLPGSVFRLAAPAQNLQELLVRGLGIAGDGDVDGRMQGFGAVLPHPGMASESFDGGAVCKPRVMVSDKAATLAFEWMDALKGGDTPSTSQISAVAERLGRYGRERALEYLDRQHQRPDRIWKRWDRVFERIKKDLSERPEEEVLKAFKIWRDISISKKNSGEG